MFLVGEPLAGSRIEAMRGRAQAPPLQRNTDSFGHVHRPGVRDLDRDGCSARFLAGTKPSLGMTCKRVMHKGGRVTPHLSFRADGTSPRAHARGLRGDTDPRISPEKRSACEIPRAGDDRPRNDRCFVFGIRASVWRPLGFARDAPQILCAARMPRAAGVPVRGRILRLE